MEVKCIICGKSIELTKTRFNKSKTKEFCCSHKCLGERNKNTETNCECTICGKKLYRKPSHLKKIKQVTCSHKCAGKLKKTRYLGKDNPNYDNRGNKNPLFKGEKIVHSGYIYVYVGETHPFATFHGRIREHRLIAERELMQEHQSVTINGKQYLSPMYEVHHINHIKTDNRVENLMIVTKEEHMRIHQEDRHKVGIYRVMIPCPVCGKEFDKNDYYMLNNGKTCSDECLEKLSNPKEKRKKRCKICGVELQNKNKLVCSQKCFLELTNKSNGVLTKCDQCGGEFKTSLTRLNRNKHNFCCRKCYFDFRQNNK